MAAFAKARVAAAKIYRTIEHRPSIDRKNDTGIVLGAITGLVELKNVDFAYPSRPDVPVLRDFSLTVAAGKTIALVGSSGSGKSTVVSLIERFYDPTAGTPEILQQSHSMLCSAMFLKILCFNLLSAAAFSYFLCMLNSRRAEQRANVWRRGDSFNLDINT